MGVGVGVGVGVGIICLSKSEVKKQVSNVIDN